METKSFDVWNERGLGVDTIMSSAYNSVSVNDNQNLCDNVYPFMQLINSNAVFFDNQKIEFIELSNGWIVHDYGQALSVASPHDISQKHAIIHSSIQAKIMQDIARIVIEKAWAAVEVIAGTATMKKYLWVESKRAKFELSGYTPSESDIKSYERLAKLSKNNQQVWEYEPIERESEMKYDIAEQG